MCASRQIGCVGVEMVDYAKEGEIAINFRIYCDAYFKWHADVQRLVLVVRQEEAGIEKEADTFIEW